MQENRRADGVPSPRETYSTPRDPLVGVQGLAASPQEPHPRYWLLDLNLRPFGPQTAKLF